MKEQVKAIIDSREPMELSEVFVLHEDVEEYEIKELPEGDIWIEDCVFERKEPSDFASSVQDGRLRDQCDRMGELDKRGFILVEGDMKDFSNLEHTQIPAKSLRGMTASIIARNNIPVVFCSEQKYLADVAVRLARKTIEDDPSKIMKSAEAVEDAPFVQQVFAAIEGIGVSTSEDLMNEFPTMEEAMAATVEDFSKVEGVGEKRAETIFNALHDSKETEGKKEGTQVFNI